MKKVFLNTLLVILSVFFLILVLLLSSYRGDIPLEKLTATYMDESSYFLKVDGINVHVRVKGSGEPIFLIHGSFSSLHTWEEWEKELSQFFMTISMDLPGHGLTGPDELKRHGMTDYANLVFGIADQLGLKEFHVAGNSMGGGVALIMASEHPERILTLNLVDAAGAPPKVISDPENTKSNNSGTFIFRLAQNPVLNKLLLKCTPKAAFNINLKQVFYDDKKISNAMVTRYYHLMRREGNRQATLNRLKVRRSYNIDFDKLNMPVLIMWGAHDNWIPLGNGKRLAAVIPGSKLKVFDNAGHVPMEEIPTDTVIEYLAFLGIKVDMDYFSAPKFFSHVK